MLTSKIKKENIDTLKQTAITLYKEGKTVREVGSILNRSHTWVWLALGGGKKPRVPKPRIKTEKERFQAFENNSLKKYTGEKITFEKWEEHTKDWPEICFCCGRKFSNNDSRYSRVHDHIVHYDAGGKHEISNIQTLCLDCNSRKGKRNWDFRGNIEMFVACG